MTHNTSQLSAGDKEMHSTCDFQNHLIEFQGVVMMGPSISGFHPPFDKPLKKSNGILYHPFMNA